MSQILPEDIITFYENTIAKASEVNANLNTLREGHNSVDSKLTNLRIYNVADYGNDIAATITAAGSNHGYIYHPKGTYTLTTNIDYGNNVAWFGSGAELTAATSKTVTFNNTPVYENAFVGSNILPVFSSNMIIDVDMFKRITGETSDSPRLQKAINTGKEVKLPYVLDLDDTIIISTNGQTVLGHGKNAGGTIINWTGSTDKDILKLNASEITLGGFYLDGHSISGVVGIRAASTFENYNNKLKDIRIWACYGGGVIGYKSDYSVGCNDFSAINVQCSFCTDGFAFNRPVIRLQNCMADGCTNGTNAYVNSKVEMYGMVFSGNYNDIIMRDSKVSMFAGWIENGTGKILSGSESIDFRSYGTQFHTNNSASDIIDLDSFTFGFADIDGFWTPTTASKAIVYNPDVSTKININTTLTPGSKDIWINQPHENHRSNTFADIYPHMIFSNRYPSTTGDVGSIIQFGGYRDIDPNHITSEIMNCNIQTDAGNLYHTGSIRLNTRNYSTPYTMSTRLSVDYNGVSTQDIVPLTAETYTLGKSIQEWKDIYALNAVTVTSDLRKKEQIEDTPLGLDFINSLTPVQYKLADVVVPSKTKIIKKTINDIETIKDGDITREVIVPKQVEEEVIIPGYEIKYKRKHHGLIAQQVKDVLDNLNINSNDFAGYIYDSEADKYALRYEEFIAPLIKSIKQLKAEVDVLKARLESLQ